MIEADVVVIGGGMAGASAAYEIAARRRVVLLEREQFCGYHSTGRSAASFTENYGNPVIRRLARASRPFFERPPVGFSEVALVAPRGILTIARTDQVDMLASAFEEGRAFVPDLTEVDISAAMASVPILRRDYVARAFLEPRSRDIDVHAAHQAFLKGLKARGGMLVNDAEVMALHRHDGHWNIQSKAGLFQAAAVVNAAGAWADIVAVAGGVRPIALMPKRRTAFSVDVPAGFDITRWPLVDDVAGQFYFKPDAGRLLVSPADATPSPPTDAQPEEIDVAIGIDRLQRATTLAVQRVTHKWAGLRSFVADGSPVVGWDDEVEGFFWLAAQGGYGIKTAPALARAAAELMASGHLPSDLREAGLDVSDLAPSRCRAAESALAAT
jgi:D-arginine dehydrogenase